jgi:hypothetical protein
MSDGATPGNPNSYTVVADLDEQDEVSMVVPYQQQKQFMECLNSVPYKTDVLWSTSATPPSTIVGNTNGVLRVTVMNRLTAPEASSSVRILVFVNAEPGFQYAAPRDLIPYSRVGVTGNFYSLNSVSTGVVQSGYDAGSGGSLTSQTGDDSVYDQVFGEKVVSMREQLHRSSLAFTHGWSNAGGIACKLITRIPLKHVPVFCGNVDNGWYSASINGGANQRVNFCKHHPINLITSCFAGYKGSVNVSVNIDHSASASLVSSLTAYRLANGGSLIAGERAPQTFLVATAGTSQVANAQFSNLFFDGGRAGQALTNTLTNTGLSVNLPYYTNSGFLISNVATPYANTDTLSAGNRDWFRVEVRCDKTAADVNDLTANVFYSTGPDFDCVFFVNVPPFWIRSYAF